MESAKEKAIREAYGERYEHLKHHLDENGWFPDEILGEEIWVLSECERRIDHSTFVTDVFWRISGLQGIETNNEWTQIESQADLPTQECLYKVVLVTGEYDTYPFMKGDEEYWINTFSHYEKIEYKKPIY